MGLRALAPVAHGELADGTPPSLLLELLRPAPIYLSLPALGAAGFGAFAKENRESPRSPSHLRYQLRNYTLCNVSALGAPRRAGFDLLRSEALPLRSPTTPRKRCPLARGFALTATRSLRGLFSVLRRVLYAGLPARNRGLPRARLRVDRRPGQPPASSCGLFPASAAVARGATGTRPCRFRRLR